MTPIAIIKNGERSFAGNPGGILGVGKFEV